jgi:hypothetical protein
MKTRYGWIIVLVGVLSLLPVSTVYADNCGSLSDCFRGNLIPALLLLLGLILFIAALWYFWPVIMGFLGRLALGSMIRGILGTIGRSRFVGAMGRLGRGLGNALGKSRAPRLPKTRGLEKQLKEHIKKLENYRRNPDKYDNKDFLKNAKDNPELRKKIIDSRIRSLEHQIKTFRETIKKLKGGK